MTQRVLKPWWLWTYKNSTVKLASARAIQDVWPPGKSGSGHPKADNIVSLGGGLLQMVSDPLPNLRWWERAQAQWGTPAGTLSPKRGWLWRPTSPGNEDVLICINAPFMTQLILKPWWLWTYQNFAVKRAFARAIPRWVTFWEVWFGGAKSGQYCVIGGGSLHSGLILSPTVTPLIL